MKLRGNDIVLLAAACAFFLLGFVKLSAGKYLSGAGFMAASVGFLIMIWSKRFGE